ncbi:ERAP1-like C-terminal domain-containing protein [Carboxylicivirga sp. A043]|uniref:M1 family metallopeptidase n=1 Tax=Carboxylicivirga litoralis TaxID=2816963 RepID=UPI0021CB0527|nr:M1 family aminopeptidase [Carboxylicivirga sp. A043]MCU4157601.1 ERAP1-like C-terminal domain-containing protein [Carboxylicivirga sp. A043]
MHKYLIPILIAITLSACNIYEKPVPDTGVSQRLAKQRAKQISNLNYHLSIIVPDDKDEPIDGISNITFDLKSKETIYLDFKADNKQLISLAINETNIDQPAIVNEHIKLDATYLQKGSNAIKIEYILGDGALNRNDNYFYALFVPDRARTAIPCFDQPDIKGRFAVKMELPNTWTGIANGEPTIKQAINNRVILEFAPSQPISTYLWAFTAGTYQFDSVKWKGKNIGLYHMVDDSIKYKRNIDEIFRQTLASLDWLEDFTAFDYPFETYNLVAIPSFQFGGMEHPGATYYRSEKIFLDENPTRNEELSRANLIAHETAHMWFGDLVTMPWFDEVWLKEVFANFMADKITEPWFQDMNHQLRFLMAHFPSSYAVDRTTGANPIGQKLKNLQNAGTLYGSIIYHKSPIVMKQLENIAGTKNLQKGIQQYVAENAYGNASWNDLIACIDQYTETDLKVWSNAWVFEPGRPILYFEPSEHNNQTWQLKQIPEHTNLASKNTYWPQEINILQNNSHLQYQMYDAKINIHDNLEEPNSLFFADDVGYGLVRLTQPQLDYWLKHTVATKDDLLRGRLVINLYENFLDGSIHPDAFLNYLQKNILQEANPIILNQLSSQLQSIYWKFIPQDVRTDKAPIIEKDVYMRIQNEENIANKKTLFRLWSNIALSTEANETLKEFLQGKQSLDGINLSDNDLIRLVTQLSIKNHSQAQELQALVMQKLKSKHNKEKLEFLLPSLSDNAANRDEFFLSLSKVENRSKEGWVQNALANLHHPLRAEHSVHYLHNTLELLEEIQLTGDIFFPIGWLRNSFSGHSSQTAYDVANQFLNNNPEYPEHLKLKILQNIDITYRAYTIKEKYY